MSGLLLPNSTNKFGDKLYVAQLFVLNEQDQVVQAAIWPNPINGKITGAFLSQIKRNLQEPINGMLQMALQLGDAKVMFRITELEKFCTEKKKIDTINSLRASGQATRATGALNLEMMKDKANDA